MYLLDLTLPTAAENLALDEALLEHAEQMASPTEYLRLWESPSPIVVIGRSSKIDQEVDRQACGELGIPVLRRCSGGAAIVAGPGCLMYAVVLSSELRPALQLIDQAHEFVLERLVKSLAGLVEGVSRQGTSDLARQGRKFSGNSLRCKRQHVLYHGTLLYDFPLELIQKCLRTPPRQPEYRAGRSHRDFVENLPVTSAAMRRALIGVWGAHRPLYLWPRELTQDLAARRYASQEWTEQL